MKWLKIALFLFVFTLLLQYRLIAILLLLLFLYLLKEMKEKMLLLVCCIYILFTTNSSIDKPNSFEGTIQQIKNGYCIVLVEESSVQIYTDEIFLYGDSVLFVGNYEAINSVKNFYTFNFEQYSHSQGIHYSISPTSIKVVRSNFNVRNIVYNRILEISNDVRKQQFMELFIYQNFTNDKTMNKSISSSLCILASYSILMKLLSYFIHPKLSEKILIICYALFGILLGMPYVFFRLILPKLPLIRNIESRERLGICIFLGIIVYPRMIVQLQFLLPNVLLLYQLFEKKTKLSVKFLLCVFQISFFHQIGVVELLLFNQFRTIYGAFYLISFFILLLFPNYFHDSYNQLISLLSRLNFIQFPIYMSIPIFLGCILVFTPLLYPKIRRKLYYACCILITVIYSKVNYFPTTVFFSIGQGDFALVDFGFLKEKVLIDCGGSQTVDTYEKYVRPYLKTRSITVDFIYISHPDFDHTGALPSIQKDFPLVTVIDEFSAVDPKLFSLLNTSKVDYEENDNSMVLYTKIGKLSYLFTGDAGIRVERDILQSYPKLDIDILKVGHHGSHTSSSDAFIRAITPKYSIISVKHKSRYGHPHQSVLDTLSRNQSKILLTSKQGAIKIVHTPFFSIVMTSSGEVDWIF